MSIGNAAGAGGVPSGRSLCSAAYRAGGLQLVRRRSQHAPCTFPRQGSSSNSQNRHSRTSRFLAGSTRILPPALPGS